METCNKRQRVDANDVSAEYEDYTSTSQTYDLKRRPLGLDNLRAGFARAASNKGSAISSLNILDVGCGTGNYLAEICDEVGTCNGLEFNRGMLAQAEAKLATRSNVTLQQGSVLDMSCFEDATFDAVIMTQVLHHLETDTHETAISEMVRVLRPGGILWLQTQTPHQHMNGFWWTPIIPKAAAVVAARFSGIPELSAQLVAAGLNEVTSMSPPEPLIAHPNYLVAEGPFDVEFRNGDSTWSAASAAELAAGQAWWRAIIDKGEAEVFLREREALRAEVGQTTAVTAIKAAAP